MKFLIDAHIPRKLVMFFERAGHDAIHTLDLRTGNRTTDAMICEFTTLEERVVVTKDADFIESFYVQGVPPRLL